MQQAAILKKCTRCCKFLPLATAFEVRVVKDAEVVYSKCRTCRPKHAASANTSVNRATVDKRCQQSQKGKARKKRARTSDAGKARNKRELATRKRRRALDPAYALMGAIAATANKLVSGEVIDSPTFVERTSFEDETEFLAHMIMCAEAIGMTLADHGKGWDTEHKIPQEAYDFSLEEDVKRCWSVANVHAMAPQDNYAKSFTILDELCMSVGADFFPTSWNGLLLTHDQKEAFYIHCNTPWVDPGGPVNEGMSDDEDEDDDEDEEESDEE